MAAAPFRASEPTEAELKAAYYSDHDLRDMYARENTERRRTGGHTYRKWLTPAQDKKMTGAFPKIREEFEVFNNNDAVIVFAQQLIESGKDDDLHDDLRKLAETVTIAKRAVPFEETITA